MVSLSSLAIIIFASRSDPDGAEFGRIVLLYSAFQLSAGLGRATTGEALSVIAPQSDDAGKSRLGGLAIAFGWNVGLLAAVMAAFLTLTVPEDLEFLVMATGVVMLFTIPTDGARFLALLRHEERRVALVDTAMEGTFLIALVLNDLLSTPTPSEVFATYLATRVIATIGHRKTVLLGLILVSRPAAWVRAAWPEAPVYLYEYILGRGVGEAVTWVIAIVGVSTAVGGYRLAHAAFGPVSVLSTGFRTLILPRARAATLQDPTRAIAVGGWFAAATAGVVALLLAILRLTPENVVQRIVGANWQHAVLFIAPIALLRAIQAIGAGGRLATRCLRLTIDGARARSLTALATIIGVYIGARIGGEIGIVYGLVAGSSVAAVTWWYVTIRGLARIKSQT